MNANILISQFANSNAEHGGVHRHKQIISDLRKLGPLTVFALAPSFSLFFQYFFRHPIGFAWVFLQVIIQGLRTKMAVVRLLKSLIICVPSILTVQTRHEKRNTQIYFETSADFSLLTCLVLQQSGWKVVTFPHNIEFLIGRSDWTSINPSTYVLECLVYSKSSEVRCISKLDQYLVAILGSPSTFYPYRPVEEVESFYKEIALKRERQNPSKRKIVLILGSVINIPSFLGMQKLLEQIAESSTSECEYVVVGNGTERFSDYSIQNIKIAGSVSNEILKKYLVECSCVLIYQIATTGILTRVVNLKLARIPVLINSSYYQARELKAAGVKVYSSFSEALIPQ